MWNGWFWFRRTILFILMTNNESGTLSSREFCMERRKSSLYSDLLDRNWTQGLVALEQIQLQNMKTPQGAVKVINLGFHQAPWLKRLQDWYPLQSFNYNQVAQKGSCNAIYQVHPDSHGLNLILKPTTLENSVHKVDQESFLRTYLHPQTCMRRHKWQQHVWYNDIYEIRTLGFN